jgi:hypothetical protein
LRSELSIPRLCENFSILRPYLRISSILIDSAGCRETNTSGENQCCRE